MLLLKTAIFENGSKTSPKCAKKLIYRNIMKFCHFWKTSAILSHYDFHMILLILS